MYTEIHTDTSYFNQDTKQSSELQVKMQKNHEVHVSLHMTDIASYTQVLARCLKLNNLKGSSLVSVVSILQH